MSTSPTLPGASHLPIQHLAGSFGDVTNSYKYYWLLAILDHIRNDATSVVSFKQLVACMVSNAWYPSSYFRLSFGKQDRLNDIVAKVRTEEGLLVNSAPQDIIDSVLGHWESRTSLYAKDIRSLATYVPYRFLRPFFSAELRGTVDWQVNEKIRKNSVESFSSSHSPCIYRIVEDNGALAIEIHPLWIDYLQTNMSIVSSHCFWHLTNYLQRNNPNVPNIVGKLFEPRQRDLRVARRFWGVALTKIKDCRCIYSGSPIEGTNISLDHFLPWSFVAHDLIWNIVPTSQHVNSSKGDCLPDPSIYFSSFARLQFDAVQAVASENKQKLLEDHALLLAQPSVHEIISMPFASFSKKLEDSIFPQIQIARNMGFVSDWSYQS